MPNPYSPPPSQRPVSSTPWYETTPADWEKTASSAWICSCGLLLVAIPASAMQFQRAPDWFERIQSVLPGPQMMGTAVYLLEVPFLALVPAALFGAMHWGLMQVSTQTWYRMVLRWICIIITVVGCFLLSIPFHGA